MAMATLQAREEHLRPYKEGSKKWQDKELFNMTIPDAFLDEHLKKDLILYGEAAQATYDTVDLQQWSRFRDKSRFAPAHLLDEDHLRSESHFAELPEWDYTAADDSQPEKERTYLYASEKSDIIRSVVRKIPGQKVTEARVWIGYVAYSAKRNDILVAWRGTQQPAEWLADGKLTQVPYYPKGQAPKAAPKRRSWNPLPLLVKACKNPLLFPKKLVYGVLAGGFSVFATAATPLLGLLNVIVTSAASRDSNGGAFKAFGAVLVRAGAAAAGVVGLVYVQTAFPATVDLAAFLVTLPFAFIGAIPFVHVVVPHLPRPLAHGFAALKWSAGKILGDDANLPYKAYVLVVAIADVALHVSPPRFLHGFWGTPLGVSSLVFIASGLVPPTWAAFIRTFAQAGEKDQEGKVQVFVHEGFHELYTKPLGEDDDNGTDTLVAKPPRSKGTGGLKQPLVHDVEADPHPKADERLGEATPQTTLHARIKKLMEAHHDVKTISVTGHSLGGALAVLSSFDLVKSGCNVSTNGRYVPVTCYSFEGPRVGNLEFANEYKRLEKQGLTALRIVNKPDIVPDVPRAFYLQNVYYALGALLNQGDAVGTAVTWVEKLGYALGFPTCYQHVGADITVDSRQVKWLRKMEGANPLANAGLIGAYHNLEVVLHVLSGYNPRGASEATPKAAARAGFGGRFTRDFALANKGGDNLNPRFGIAPNWHSTLVGQVVAAKYPAPEPVPLREPRESGTEGDLEKVARDSDARRYPEPRPAIIQPYDATQSPPNWGADEARVVGQGPQDPVHPELHTNLWLEDIHAWDQATFDQPQYYGLKAPIEESGTSTSGGASSA